MNPFGRALRWARTQKNLSLDALAKKIGRPKSKGYLSMIENGVCPPPTTSVIEKLARTLDVSTSELMLIAYAAKAPKRIRTWVIELVDIVPFKSIPRRPPKEKLPLSRI